MDTRLLLSVAIISLLISSSIPADVFAHTTLGNPVPSGRTNATHVSTAQDASGIQFASNTGKSLHIAGPTGYVFPGSGQIGQQARTFPAFRDPNEELQGPRTSNVFSPSAAILTSSATFANKGDLILAINFTTAGLSQKDINIIANIACSNTASGTGTLTADDTLVTEAPTIHREGLRSLRYRSLSIYVPPEFTPPVTWASQDNSNIVSTMTDDFSQIVTYKATGYDPFGPNWWVILIAVREDLLVFPLRLVAVGSTLTGFTKINTSGPVKPTTGLPCTFNGKQADLLMEDRWYYIRLNEMSAPTIAGEYFFKFFLNGTYAPSVTGKTYCDMGLGSVGTDGSGTFVGRVCSDQSAGGNIALSNTPLSSSIQTMPAQNWPSLLVKAEIDPAVILGTIRQGGIANSTLFGQAVKLPCKVVAEGTANDPLTGKPTGRRVVAWGFTNATRQGRYEIQGLAAGTYTVTGSCAGFPRLTLERQITLSRGQSLHGVDFFLRAGAVIAAKVNCKLIEDPNVAQNCQGFPLLHDADSLSDRDGSCATSAGCAPSLTKYTVTYNPPAASATGFLWFSGAGSPGNLRCRDGDVGSALIPPTTVTTAGSDACVAASTAAPVDVNGLSPATTGRKPFDPGTSTTGTGNHHLNENTQLAFFDAMNIAGFSFDPSSSTSACTGNINNRNDYFSVTSFFASKGFNVAPAGVTAAQCGAAFGASLTTPVRGGDCLGSAIVVPVLSVVSGATTLSDARRTRPFGACAGNNLINWNPVDFTELGGWRPFTVEIYDASGNLVSFSPHNNTNLPYTSYTWDNITIIYQRAAFPWESVIGPGFSPVGVHNGVGPALSPSFPDVGIWWANDHSSIIRWQFGNKPGFAFSDGFGTYGAPSGMDAHVPQTFATWTDGLSPGTYTIRVWMNGYVQLQNFTFVIPSFEEAGIVQREIDLFRSSVVNLLVHFSDTQEGTLTSNPIGGPDPGRYVIVQAFDANNRFVGFNYTWTQANTTDLTVEINGLGMGGPDIFGLIRRDPTGRGGTSKGVGGDFTSPFGGVLANKGAFFPVGDNNIKRGFFFWNDFPQRHSPLPFLRYNLLQYTGDNDYGLRPGTYTFKVFTRGYLQTVFPATTIGFGGLPANLSFTLIRGAGANLTVNSKDSQVPPQRIPWRFGDFYFQDLLDATGEQAKVNAGFFPLCRNRISDALGDGISAQCAESGEVVQQGDVNVGKIFQGQPIVVGTILPSVGSSIYHYLVLIKPPPAGRPPFLTPPPQTVTYPEAKQFNAIAGNWFEGSQTSQTTSRPGIDPNTGNIVWSVGQGFPFVDCATKRQTTTAATCLNITPFNTAASPFNFANFPNRHYLLSNLLGPVPQVVVGACAGVGQLAVGGICVPGIGDFARTRDPQNFGMGFTSSFVSFNVGTFNGTFIPDRYGPDGAAFFARSSPQTFTSLFAIAEASYGKESLGLGIFFPPLGVDDYDGFLRDAKAGTAHFALMGLDSGLYKPAVDTFGYLTTPESRLPVSLTRGSSMADIKTDVFTGAVIEAIVTFKTEDVFTTVPNNMFFRLVVTDQKGNVVAEEHSGRFEAGRYDFQPGFRFGTIPAPAPAQTSGVKQFKFFIAGFQPGPTTSVFPTIDGGSGKSGIPDGTYNVNLQVYFVSRAAPTRTGTVAIAGNPSTGPGSTDPNGFPPGMLQGYPWYGGFRPGFGPYAARGTISVTVTRLPGTGVTTATFELDRLGTIRGLVLGYNLQGDLRTISWAKVNATGSPGVAQPTFDGQYEIFLQPGSYNLRAIEYNGNLGHTSQSKGITVTIGADITGIDFQLVESGVPIPEFPLASLLVLAIAMAASATVLRRVRRARSA